MENSDAPGVHGEPGGYRASGRGRESPDAHFFFADVVALHCTKFHTISSCKVSSAMEIPQNIYFPWHKPRLDTSSACISHITPTFLWPYAWEIL